MACTPDPEDSWPLWSIATHKLKSPDPRVPSDAGTRRYKSVQATAATSRVCTAGQGGPCSSSKRGRWGQPRASDKTSSAHPASWGAPSRAKHAERSRVLPSSVQALGNTQDSSAELLWACSPLFCTRSGLGQPLWFVSAFSQVQGSR